MSIPLSINRRISVVEERPVDHQNTRQGGWAPPVTRRDQRHPQSHQADPTHDNKRRKQVLSAKAPLSDQEGGSAFPLSNVEDDACMPEGIAVNFDAMVGRGLYVQVESMALRIDQLSGDVCPQPRVGEFPDLEPGRDESLGIQLQEQIVEPVDQQPLTVFGLHRSRPLLYQVDRG